MIDVIITSHYPCIVTDAISCKTELTATSSIIGNWVSSSEERERKLKCKALADSKANVRQIKHTNQAHKYLAHKDPISVQ